MGGLIYYFNLRGGLVPINFILWIFLAVLFWPYQGYAQLKPGGFGDSKGPMAISADRLEADDLKGVVTFTGAVVARQGEMALTCDQMKVYYTARTRKAPAPAEKTPPQAEKGSVEVDSGVTDSGVTNSGASDSNVSPFDSSGRQVDRVECVGNVKVVEGDRMAVGNSALYLARSLPRRIILTGEARVWQGQDSLTGHQVTYLLDQKRSTVEGNRQSRVRTIFHTEAPE